MKLLGVCGKFWNGKGREMEFLNVFFLNIGYRSINFNFSHNKIVRHCIWKILEMEEECPSMIGVEKVEISLHNLALQLYSQVIYGSDFSY